MGGMRTELSSHLFSSVTSARVACSNGSEMPGRALFIAFATGPLKTSLPELAGDGVVSWMAGGIFSVSVLLLSSVTEIESELMVIFSEDVESSFCILDGGEPVLDVGLLLSDFLGLLSKFD